MSRWTLLCLALLPGATAFAQETTGDVRGRLVAPDSTAIAAAEVSVSGPHLLGTRRTTTAADGVFLLLGLPPGSYAVHARAVGHRPIAITGVAVVLGRTTGLGTFTLERASVVMDELTIASPPVTLDPVRTTYGATLGADEYAVLPSDRDYRSLIAMLPHVNATYDGDAPNSAGSTGLENGYYIDGVNVSEPLRGHATATFPHNMIRSVEVRSGGYDAQFGRGLGAVVNAITYTGSNVFEAQLFAYGTGGGLTARSRTAPLFSEAGAASWDAGVRLSGPLRRDRLWFAAGWNPRRTAVDRTIGAFGTFRDVRTVNAFAGTLSWQPRAASAITLSLAGDPTVEHDVGDGVPGLTPLNADIFLRRLESGGTALSLRWVFEPRPGVRVEASLARADSRDNYAEDIPGQTEQLVFDFVAGTVDGNWNILRARSRRYSASARATVMRGRHLLTGGVEVENATVNRSGGTTGAGIIVRWDSARWEQHSQGTAGSFANRAPALYVQDAWRVHDRVTVNVGLRWSHQWLIGPAGSVAQSLGDEWQPRVGVSWMAARDGRHRLFGSYGRFFQQQPLFLGSTFYTDFTNIIRYYSVDPRTAGATPDSSVDASWTATQFANARGVRAEHVDEVTAGYERLITAQSRATLRFVHRAMASGMIATVDSTGNTAVGNPGTGDLSWQPPATRRYTAVELSLEGRSSRASYRAAYVLSRAAGNYTGLFDSDGGGPYPGQPRAVARPGLASSDGLLPNDRTHVLKVAASWLPVPALSLGVFATVQSGTPLNDFVLVSSGGHLGFAKRRGTAGRTPATWDANLRVSWSPTRRTTVVADLLHAGNPRAVVARDQLHYFGLDSAGQPALPNPNYLAAVRYQPPMMARLGVELSR